MKRFGRYDNDFNGLFECYAKVGTIVERELPSISREPIMSKTGDSFPGAKFIKVFVQQKGRGADLVHLAKIDSIGSDDGECGTVITGKDGDKTLHICTIKSGVKVTVSDKEGSIENTFVTPTPARYDNKSKEITVIQVEEV